MKRLLLRADDLGYSEGINYRISKAVAGRFQRLWEESAGNTYLYGTLPVHRAEKEKPPGEGEKLWTVTTIGYMMKNKVYLSKTIWNKTRQEVRKDRE